MYDTLISNHSAQQPFPADRTDSTVIQGDFGTFSLLVVVVCAAAAETEGVSISDFKRTSEKDKSTEYSLGESDEMDEFIKAVLGIQEIIAAIIGALVAGVITWRFTKSDLGQKNNVLESQLSTLNEKQTNLKRDLGLCQKNVSRLTQYEVKYNNVKKRLKSSSVVKTYNQPVILVGPRAVGKTSLLAQWHAPWDHSRLMPSQTYKASTVPIYDFTQKETEPHFADAEILTDVHIHLKLTVHDFPGELSAQRSIVKRAKEETEFLRKSTGKKLGIVLICMFDAENTAKGLDSSTIDYYNGELFSNLRELVAFKNVEIDRLILVFNKYDLLKKRYQNRDDKTLLQNTLEKYEPLLRLLRGISNHEKVCEVFTILSREDMTNNNRGAPIVLGEAARRFIEVMAGPAAVQEVLKETATNYASPIFS
ncbi:MAG: GTPase domain-containing protein [Anaerolineae bacterium]|nr:GTPase domain-containing protein [Anaerolineae bacterium]